MPSNWRRWLPGDPLPWLLDGGEPGVRARALVSLAGMDPADPEVSQARAAAAGTPAVAAILRAQRRGGWWATPFSLYWPKYRASLWQLLTLAELGADGADPRIRRGVSAWLVPFLGRVTRGFRRPAHPCLMGYGLYTLLRLKAAPAPTRRLLELVVRIYRQGGWPCPHSSRPHCTWGAVKVLKGLAQVPPSELPGGGREAVDRAARFLLDHRFFFDGEAENSATGPAGRAGDGDAAGAGRPAAAPRPYVSNPGWLRFAFPQFYQSDLLEMLWVLARLGWGGHPRTAALAAHLARQAGPDGRFAPGRSYGRLLYAEVAPPGVPSRWLTLLALEALDGIG